MREVIKMSVKIARGGTSINNNAVKYRNNPYNIQQQAGLSRDKLRLT